MGWIERQEMPKMPYYSWVNPFLSYCLGKWGYFVIKSLKICPREICCGGWRWMQQNENYSQIQSGYRLGDRRVGVRVPAGSRIFFSLWRSDRFWGSPRFLSNGYRGLLPGSKAVRTWSWSLTPTSANWNIPASFTTNNSSSTYDYHRNRDWRHIRLWGVETPKFSRPSAQIWRLLLYEPAASYPQKVPGTHFFSGQVCSRTIVRP
jgi:hypothetical protein